MSTLLLLGLISILAICCNNLYRRINLLERDVTYLMTGEMEIKR